MLNSGHNGTFPLWIALACLWVSFAGIVNRDLWTPDEPRDAAIALEMGRNGDLVIPHLAGKPFVEKPPLYFAVAAGFSRALGRVAGDTGAIRLSTTAWGLGTILVTFLLAQRLFDRPRAILASAILATMVGFILNMHWIRVDAALIFCVAAATWSFAEVYVGQRRWFCLAGGLFTAGAFLAKGVVGPLLVGIAWTGLTIPWLMGQRGKKFDLLIAPHLLALTVFLIPVGAWMWLLRLTGGPGLWHEWFYDNHFGRLTGTATALGHMRPGHPFYYVETLLFYALPWLPLILLWFVSIARNLIKTRTLTPTSIFLGVWSIGSLILLSASVTKRDIYLAPIMPAFALICIDALTGKMPRWINYFFGLWTGLALLVLAASAISPLWAGFLPRLLPGSVPIGASTLTFLRTFGLGHVITSICLLGALTALIHRRESLTPAIRLTAVTAFLFIGFFAVPGKAFDIEKSLEKGTRDFAARIPAARKARVAGWGFTETNRAMFYYYCDWTVPLVDDKSRVLNIVAGKDREFDSVIVTEDTAIPEFFTNVPHKVTTEEYVGAGKHKRALYWIERTGNNETDASMKKMEITSEK